MRLNGAYLPPTHQTLVVAQNGWVDDRDGRSGARLSRPAISGIGKQSALRIEATQEGAPAIRVAVVSLQLVKSFAIRRTKANSKPPAAVPHITGADTQPQLSVALGAPFHSCSRCLTRVNRAENNTVPRSCPQSSAHYVDRRTSTTLADFRGRGFPNHFFCNSWVVGFLEGPTMVSRTSDWRGELGVRFGCVLADAGYGLSAPFRQGLTARKLAWAVGIPRHLKVYPADVRMIWPVAKRGRPRQRHIPDILSIPAEDMLANAKWHTIGWRTGTKGKLKARFASTGPDCSSNSREETAATQA